ncbi:MAG: outer membrane lipoprotein-sorting protein [Acidobacteriaceae bacterium]
MLVLAATASAQAGKSLQAILSQERSRMEQTDVRGSGHLVEVAATGARTNNSIAIASHWFPDGLRTLLTLDIPANGTLRYLLAMEPSGRTSIEILRKDESAPTRLAPEQWGQGVAGTLFYPEDFFNGQFFWTRQALLPGRNYGARPCYVLRSEPGPGQFSQYSSVTTYLDQKSLAPVYVEAAGRNGAPTKQFVFYDLEQNGGVWNARQVEVKQIGQPGSSLLLIDHGSPHAHLQHKDFSLTPSKPTRSKPSPS